MGIKPLVSENYKETIELVAIYLYFYQTYEHSTIIIFKKAWFLLLGVLW